MFVRSFRQRFSRWTWLTMLAVAAGSPAWSWAATPSASQLLPENTVIFASVLDAPEMAKRFQTTALGRMSQDPQLRPLLDNLYGSAAEGIASLKEYIGASLPELLSIPQGELAFALVTVEEGPPAFLLFVDTGSKVNIARALLNKLCDLGASTGGKRSTQNVSGTIVTIIGPPGEQTPGGWFDKEGLIVAGTNADVLKQVLLAWDNRDAKTLSSNPKFVKIWDRCRRVKTEQPQVFFYADPVTMFKAAAEQDLAVNFALMMVTRLGIDGLQAIGGSWAMDCGSLDEVVQFHVLLESPRGGVLEPIALESGDNTPEPFIPGDAASYVTLHWRMEASYKAIGRLYDSFRGEGSFANMFGRQITQLTGVDFEKELLPSLDGRVTYASWLEQPVTPMSQVHLFAFRLKDPGPMTKVIESIVKRAGGSLTRSGASDKEFYQETLPGGNVRRGPNQPCLGILDNYFVITTRPSLYQKAIATLQTPDESLAKSLDFKLVASKMSGRAGEVKPAMIMFRRPEEAFRLLYAIATGEDTRSGLRRGAERSGFLRTINSALDANPLPPFAVLERYLAPSGGFLIDDESGLHYTGFDLRRK
jgi:hypothetical protein